MPCYAPSKVFFSVSPPPKTPSGLTTALFPNLIRPFLMDGTAALFVNYLSVLALTSLTPILLSVS